MSADNMICIQYRQNGRWYVWMDFLSNDRYEPKPHSASFATQAEAWAYARGWVHGEDMVEYGIQELIPEHDTKADD